jgi:CHAT domain-containing protein
VANEFSAARPWEGRLSGGLPHAPFDHSRDGLGATKQLDQAKRVVETWVKTKHSPEALAALALLFQADGKFDQAIALMEQILEKDSTNTHVLNDLAVAHLARSESTKQVYDLLLALSAISRALELNPSFPEARFNLALILSKLHLAGEARVAWEQFLDQEENTPWADEAHAYWIKLNKDTEDSIWKQAKTDLQAGLYKGLYKEDALQEIIRRHPHQVRILAEEELLPAWAESIRGGNNLVAEIQFRAVRSVSFESARFSGDSMLADAVTSIDQVSVTNRRCFRDLVLGHLAYAEGLSLLAKGSHGAALIHFDNSFALLSCGPSPFKYLARIQAATCKHYLRRYGEVQVEMGEYARLADLQRYPILRARAFWLEGLASIMLDQFVSSLASYKSALQLYEKVRYLDGVVALHFLIAENLRFQGERTAAWEHRLKALEVASSLGSSIWRHNTLFDAGEAANSGQLYHAALIFYSEMLRGPFCLQDPISRAEALVRRSRTLMKVGEVNAAFRDLKEADRWIKAIPDNERRGPIYATREVMLAELTSSTDPVASIRHIDPAIAFYSEPADVFKLPGLLRLRASMRLRLGNVPAAEADYRTAVEVGESGGVRLIGESLRLSYLEQLGSVHDAIVIFYSHDKARPDKGLEYSERLRSWEGGEEPRVEGASLPSFQRQLANKTVILRYMLVSNRLLIWVIANDRFSFYERLVNQASLGRRVRDFRRSLERRAWTESERKTAVDLYKELLEPVAGDLRSTDTLIIIPDKVLHLVPFSALVNGRTGSYLVEERQLGVASSISLYLRALARDRRPDQVGGPSLLAIGDPAFDRETFRDLVPLRGAEREVKAIAEAYGRSIVLTGPQASKDAVLSYIDQYTILHFAGHIRYNSDFPLLSYIPFAATGRGKDKDLLYAREIYGLRFDKTRLAVFAGCESLAASDTNADGLYSFARPLVARGISAVIGSSWQVRDKESEIFFKSVHLSIAGGHDAIEAVRQAQLSFVSSPDPSRRTPGAWSAFQVFGGVAQ